MNPRVWFKSISLENVRSFGKKQTIYFTEDGTENGKAARWNVILGDNGTGKTTVLKGLVGLVYDSIMLSTYFVESFKRTLDTSFTVGHSFEIFEIDTKIVKFEKQVSPKPYYPELYVAYTEGPNYINPWDEPRNKIKLFAYGASRRIGSGALLQNDFFSETDAILESFVTLFRDDASLLNAEEWLKQADYISLKEEKFSSQYSRVLNLLRKLFRDEVTDIYINTESGVPKVFFKTHYGDVRLHELSLGYKTLIAWMVDFAKGLLDRYPNSKDPLSEPAVCLVDEIDLHLHPKFQRSIIKFLTETFPNTQFIVTAHSPLIVQSAEDANIILLKREGNETHVAEGIDVHSWRIDQILSSDLFGGVSVRAPEIEERMARRRTLLRKDKRTPEENLELEELEKEMSDLPVMETREAIKAIDIISKAVISER